MNKGDVVRLWGYCTTEEHGVHGGGVEDVGVVEALGPGPGVDVYVEVDGVGCWVNHRQCERVSGERIKRVK